MIIIVFINTDLLAELGALSRILCLSYHSDTVAYNLVYYQLYSLFKGYIWRCVYLY